MVKRKPPEPRQSFLRRIINSALASMIRNPWPTGAAIATILVGASTLGVANYIEPWWYVSHSYLREWGEPIIKTQNTQAVGIDRFLLFQQQNALANAKADPAVRTSPIVQERIQNLESQEKETKLRICKATGKHEDCQ